MLSTNVVTCSYIICHISHWRHNGRGGISNHQPRHCLLNRLSRRRSKKTSKLRVTCLCVWNSPVAGESSAHMASNAENVSIWWRHHDKKVRAYKGKSNHNHCHKTIDLDTEEMKPVSLNRPRSQWWISYNSDPITVTLRQSHNSGHFKWLWPGDAPWGQLPWTSLVQVTVRCLKVPGYYLYRAEL